MQKDYELIRGQTKGWTIKFGHDITDYKVFITLKSRIDMPDAEAEIAQDVPIINPELGIVSVELTSTETADLAGDYYYDIKYLNTDTPPKSFTILIGVMTFQKNVTIREA